MKVISLQPNGLLTPFYTYPQGGEDVCHPLYICELGNIAQLKGAFAEQC